MSDINSDNSGLRSWNIKATAILLKYCLLIKFVWKSAKKKGWNFFDFDKTKFYTVYTKHGSEDEEEHKWYVLIGMLAGK